MVKPKIDYWLVSSIPKRSNRTAGDPSLRLVKLQFIQCKGKVVWSCFFLTSHLPRRYFTVNTNNTPKASILFRSLAPFSIQIRVKLNHPSLCIHAVSISVFQFSILISSSFRSKGVARWVRFSKGMSASTVSSLLISPANVVQPRLFLIQVPSKS